MSKSKFLVEIHCPLVADSSFVINLNATCAAIEILKAIPHDIVITESAAFELERGKANGHRDAEKLEVLIQEGLIRKVILGEVGDQIYETLVSGETRQTLDDGEAATIAYSVENSAIALIDERKARRIGASDFPHLEMVSSVEFLLCSHVQDRLGIGGGIPAIMGSLLQARMRVPDEHVKALVSIIGQENATKCHSLSRRIRQLP